MPGVTTITNPTGTYVKVTDFTTGLDASGFEIVVGKDEVYTVRANAAITAGQALSWVAPTTTVPVSATPMAAATAVQNFAGVALESAAIGEQVAIQRRGFAVVLIDGTVADGGFLLAPATTTGTFTGSATAGAGAKVLGVNKAAAASGKAFVFLDPVIMPQTA